MTNNLQIVEELENSVYSVGGAEKLKTPIVLIAENRCSKNQVPFFFT
jgi:hypothetical protein